MACLSPREKQSKTVILEEKKSQQSSEKGEDGIKDHTKVNKEIATMQLRNRSYSHEFNFQSKDTLSTVRNGPAVKDESFISEQPESLKKGTQFSKRSLQISMSQEIEEEVVIDTDCQETDVTKFDSHKKPMPSVPDLSDQQVVVRRNYKSPGRVERGADVDSERFMKFILSKLSNTNLQQLKGMNDKDLYNMIN